VKAEAKINRTLNACEKYDLDPVLDRIINHIETGRDDGTLAKNPKDALM
jgi:hypothetical protein